MLQTKVLIILDVNLLETLITLRFYHLLLRLPAHFTNNIICFIYIYTVATNFLFI